MNSREAKIEIVNKKKNDTNLHHLEKRNLSAFLSMALKGNNI